MSSILKLPSGKAVRLNTYHIKMCSTQSILYIYVNITVKLWRFVLVVTASKSAYGSGGL